MELDEHEDAIRDSFVRILMPPYFLYRLGTPVELDKLATGSFVIIVVE